MTPPHSTMRPHPRPRRHRTSCTTCRKRKSKCDGEKPCSPCRIRAEGDKCSYEEEDSSSSSTHSGRATAGSHNAHKQAKRRAHDPEDRADAAYLSDDRRHYTSKAATVKDPIESLALIQEQLASIQQQLQEDGIRKPQSNDNEVRSSDDYHSQAKLWVPGSVPSYPHPYPLPPPLEPKILQTLLAILPSQGDCEIMMEYLLKEADFLVTSASTQWLLPIWSRFVYGARVTRTEATVLAAAIAVAALLLSEFPNIYYPTHSSPQAVHGLLIDFVEEYIDYRRGKSAITIPREIVNECIIVGLAVDHVRFARQGKAVNAWVLLKQTVQHHHLLDEESLVWKSFDDLSAEMVRRVLWHVIICQRVLNIYADHGNAIETDSELIKVKHPQQFSTMFTSEPFTATRRGIRCNPYSSPAGSDDLTALPFICDLSSSPPPRFHRTKTPAEAAETAACYEHILNLSRWGPDVANYVSQVKRWQLQRWQPATHSPNSTTSLSGDTVSQEIHSGFQSGPRVVNGLIWTSQPSVAASDHRREALLHQGLALYDGLKTQRELLSADFPPPIGQPPTHLTEFSEYRRLSHACVSHQLIAQLICAALTPWLAEEGALGEQLTASANGSRPPSASPADQAGAGTWKASSLLAELQQAAYQNVRDIMSQIEIARAVTTSGRVVYFGSFAAYVYFYAATTLAVGLVGAGVVHHEPRDARHRHGGIRLRDRYTDVNSSAGRANWVSANGGVEIVRTTIPSQDRDVKHLAADILKLRDVLALYKANYLAREGWQRLNYLIDVHRIEYLATKWTAPIIGSKANSTPSEGSYWPSDHDHTPDASAAGLEALAPSEVPYDKPAPFSLEELLRLDSAGWEQMFGIDALT